MGWTYTDASGREIIRDGAAINAEALAEDAERRALEATTQDERENWQRLAAFWWNRA